jgi:large subunit ribosomal protein L10
MAQTKEQKKSIVKDLADKLKNSKAVVFSDYKGLAVKDMMALRGELRKEGIDLKVAKKTLINLALKDAGLDIDARKFEGQVALAISSQDEVAAAKIIAKTATANENLKIIGGILGTKELSAEEAKALSAIPGKQELLAKLAGSINAPISGFINVLAGNLRGLVQVLKALSEVKN